MKLPAHRGKGGRSKDSRMFEPHLEWCIFNPESGDIFLKDLSFYEALELLDLNQFRYREWRFMILSLHDD